MTTVVVKAAGGRDATTFEAGLAALPNPLTEDSFLQIVGNITLSTTSSNINVDTNGFRLYIEPFSGDGTDADQDWVANFTPNVDNLAYGIASSAALIMPTDAFTAYDMFGINTPNVTIRNMQISVPGSFVGLGSAVFEVNHDGFVLENSITRYDTTGNFQMFVFFRMNGNGVSGMTANCRNNLLYFPGNVIDRQIFRCNSHSGNVLNVDSNCIIVPSDVTWPSTGNNDAVFRVDNGATINAYNNAIFGFSLIQDASSSGTITGDYNHSNVAASGLPGGAGVNNVGGITFNQTQPFNDAQVATFDAYPIDSSALFNSGGTSLSTDALGTSRPQGTQDDAGMIEITVEGGSTQTITTTIDGLKVSVIEDTLDLDALVEKQDNLISASLDAYGQRLASNISLSIAALVNGVLLKSTSLNGLVSKNKAIITNLNSFIRKINNTETLDLGAHISRGNDAVIELEALVEKQNSQITVNLDALTNSVLSEIIDLDAVVGSVETVFVSLDAQKLKQNLLRTTNLTAFTRLTSLKISNLDANVIGLGNFLTASLNAYLIRDGSSSVSPPPIFNNTEFWTNILPFSRMDAFINGNNLVVTVNLGAGIISRVLLNTDTDALLFKEGLVKTTSLGALLASNVENTVVTELDAALQGALSVNVEIDSQLETTFSISLNMDMILQNINNTETVVIDAVMQSTELVLLSLNALLKQTIVTTTDLGSYIAVVKSRSTGMDALTSTTTALTPFLRISKELKSLFTSTRPN